MTEPMSSEGPRLGRLPRSSAEAGAVTPSTGAAGRPSRLGGPRAGVPIAWIAALFFVSGVPALIYQMAWQRILALHSGVGTYSVAMIVAAYMAGLGVGSLVGGLLSRRLGARAALFAFAGVELSIGLFAAASCALYYDLLYLRGVWSFEATWQTGLGHFLALLPPTCLMGMTLPLIVRALVRDVETAPRTVGILYALNTLGAAFGALATPWILIRMLGIRDAVLVGVGCNVVVGLGALLLGGSRDASPRATEAGRPTGLDGPADVVAGRRPLPLWIALYALSGFIAIALELVWFRLTDVGVKSTAFTFGTVLAMNLLGIGAGSLVGALLAARIREPLRAFLACQCLILLSAGLAVLLLVRLPADLPGLRALFAYWGSYEGLIPRSEALPALLGLYGGLPTLLLAVPTFLMGLAFVALQRAIQDERRTSGFKVGLLQAANILGCVAGGLVIGLLAFSWLGTAGTLRILVGGGVFFALLGCRAFGVRSRFAPLGLAMVVVAAALPGGEALWMRMHGRAGGPAFFEEDMTGVVAVTPEPDGLWRLSVDGKGQGWIPFGGLHSVLGALPVTLHPEPKRVAIIGLGSGDTAWAASCRPETERVTVFEISGPQPRALRRLAEHDRFPQLDRLLGDPRVELVIADGRNALATDRRGYDLIEADAIRPGSAYSGNLYSVEFFRQCAGRLNPGGVMCTWSPTARVRATFLQAFDHVLEAGNGLILIGANEPIRFDPGAWGDRLARAEVADHLGPGVVAECLDYVAGARLVDGEAWGPAPVTINHDLYPRDEFSSRR